MKSENNANPPMELPIKKRPLTKAMLFRFAISAWIVLEMGMVPSIRPWIIRIKRASLIRSQNPKAIIHTMFTIHNCWVEIGQNRVIIMDGFLPIRSAIHPHTIEPTTDPKKKAVVIRAIYVLIIVSSIYI